jgi:hypothetical protein
MILDGSFMELGNHKRHLLQRHSALEMSKVGPYPYVLKRRIGRQPRLRENEYLRILFGWLDTFVLMEQTS